MNEELNFENTINNLFKQGFTEHSFLILLSMMLHFYHGDEKNFPKTFPMFLDQMEEHAFLKPGFSEHFNMMNAFFAQMMENLDPDSKLFLISLCIYQINKLYPLSTKQKIAIDFANLMKASHGNSWREKKSNILDLADDLGVTMYVTQRIQYW